MAGLAGGAWIIIGQDDASVADKPESTPDALVEEVQTSDNQSTQASQMVRALCFELDHRLWPGATLLSSARLDPYAYHHRAIHFADVPPNRFEKLLVAGNSELRPPLTAN